MRVSAIAILIMLAVFTMGTGVLVTSLYRVQVNDVAAFRKSLERQATRRISVPGRRGRILDRTGAILADCRPCRDLVCRLECFQRGGARSNTVNAVAAELVRLGAAMHRELTISPAQIDRHLRESSALPLTVAGDLTDSELARFSERAIDFPGFSETLRYERVYPNGTFAAHLLGYTGRGLPQTDTGDNVVHYYEDLEVKGRSGVEGYYNDYLAGAAGERLVRVDARGFRKDAGVVVREPEHGPDLRLTIDSGIQHALERALDGVSGAGVVLDPRDGAVLAMASAPTFNPDEWRRRHREYLTDSSRPLYNRAVSGLYPPGSIFKPITSLAALKRHAADPDGLRWTSDSAYDCPGVFVYGTMRLHCWDRYGHGPINLRKAIEQSCNAYFCNLGLLIGTNALFSTAYDFGLGARTGIDLGGEAAGGVYGEPWYPGLVCQTAIGQGMLQVTPLQMAVVCAALANGGRIYTPYLHFRGTGEPAPRPARTVVCASRDLELVRSGMRDVVEVGTGRRIRTRFGEGREKYNLKVSCAGKTGTAERGRERKDTWIIAFAPYDRPTIAIAMVVERGESGGKTTAPRVHQVLAYIFGEEGEGA